MRAARVVAFVAVGVAGTAPAFPQESGDGGALRVRLEEGRPVHLRQRMRTEQAVDLGFLPMVTETVVCRDMTLVPLGKTETGGWRVTWTFDRVRGFLRSPLHDGSFDSSKPVEGESSLLTVPFVAFGGASFTVELGPRGEIVSVEGGEEAAAAAAARYGDEADMYRVILTRAWTEERLRAELGHVLQVAPYPEAALGDDTRWTATTRLPGTTGVAFDVTSEIRVDANARADLVELAATGTGTATVDSGRASPVFEVFQDEVPEEWFVSSSYSVSKEDGLPLGFQSMVWVSAQRASDDGEAGTFQQRSRFDVERIFEEELPGVRKQDTLTGLDRFELIPFWHPEAYTERLRWARRKAQVHVAAEELDAARAVYADAVAVARDLAAGKIEPAETDGDAESRGRWWVALQHDLAMMEFDAESWSASAAAWRGIFGDEGIRAKAAAGDGWLAWEIAHAGVMCAQSLGNDGDTAAAVEQMTAAGAELAAARARAPDDAALTDLHAWLLDRWSALLAGADDAAGALAKGEEAVAIRDALAKDGGRAPGQVRDLVDRLWELGDLALAAGDAAKAAALLDRAGDEVEALFEYDDGFRGYQQDIRTRQQACVVIAAGAEPGDAAQALRVAYLLVQMKRHADAVAAFETALADESIRTDWDEHNLYNGACAAALAHASAADAEKQRFADLALGWLGPHVEHLRGFLGSDDPGQVEWATGYLQWCREGDPDLASIRDLPGFTKLFP